MGDLQPVIKASIGIAIYPENGATGEQFDKKRRHRQCIAKKQNHKRL